MKMRSKRMGALRSTGGGRFEQDFGRRRRRDPAPPRPRRNARGPWPRGPDGTADAAAPAAGGRRAGSPASCDGAAAAPRRRLRQARRGRLPPPNYHQSHAPRRVSSQKGLSRHEANDLRLRPPRHREKESLRVARRRRSGAIPLLSTQLHVVVAATSRVRPRRGGDRDPRQRRLRSSRRNGRLSSWRRRCSARRPDPGRAGARAGARQAHRRRCSTACDAAFKLHVVLARGCSLPL